MDTSRYSATAWNVINSSLEPGETLFEVCEFNNSDGMFVGTAILSNRYVGFLKGRSRYPLIPISKISQISIVEKGRTISLSFFWEGREEVLVSSHVVAVEAKAFAEHLKQLVNAREVLQQTSSLSDEIAKLAQLANEGVLSKEEFERAKELFLGRPSSQIDQSVQLLRNLKELQKQGVLSESEFNMKKWDVLSKRDFQ